MTDVSLPDFDSWDIPPPFKHPGAACRDGPSDWWFESATAEQQAQAKATCARCDVRVRCLTWAIAANQRDGIYGGLDRLERRDLRQDPDALAELLEVAH